MKYIKVYPQPIYIYVFHITIYSNCKEFLERLKFLALSNTFNL